MNERGRTEYKEENLDDPDEIFCLESEFRVSRVRIASAMTGGPLSRSVSRHRLRPPQTMHGVQLRELRQETQQERKNKKKVSYLYFL